MKLENSEVEMFKILKQSAMGVQLRRYCEHVIKEYGDVRTMEHDDLQARRDALKIIEDEFITRLKS